MMKGFNWGHGIFLFYVIFVAVLITAVYASTKYDRSLVLDDYYSLDLEYQNRYDQIQNGMESKSFSVEYDKTAKQIYLNFDFDTPAQGLITMYRPSDKAKDFELEIEGNKTAIPSSDLIEGLWKIKVAYTVEGKKYYDVSEIYI